MLGTIGVTLLGMVLMSASEPHDIAGQWIGDDWGVVVLKQSPSGEYEGSFTGSVPDKSGAMQLKWSRFERRFNGTWQEGDHRRGKISLRVVDGEIRGAWTTPKRENSQPGTPRLGDLLWVRPATTQRGAEHVFGDDVIRSRPRQPGEIPDSEMPRVLLIRTEADVPGGERVAEMIERTGDRHFKFASGSRLKIGNHAVTILFIGQDSVIVESDGRWKRWNVAQDFADAVAVGPRASKTQAAETPSMLLLRTVADDRPSSSGSGNLRIAEIIDARNKRLKFRSGSALKIGNHTVTFHGIWENSVIVESDGRRKRWTVGQDFADAVDMGSGLPVTD